MVPCDILDGKLFEILLALDQKTAQECQRLGCPCGGRLHRADYPRKPRGYELGELEDLYRKRISFCCDRDGCRRRCTPPSLRFMGRQVYLGAVMLWACVLWVLELPQTAEVPRRTVKRWLHLWQHELPVKAVWRELRGRLVPSVNLAEMPASLLARFPGSPQEQLVATLRFLSPLSTG